MTERAAANLILPGPVPCENPTGGRGVFDPGRAAPMLSFGPLGDRGFLARFETEDDAAGWAAAVREEPPRGVLDVVLAYKSAAVYLDPDAADLAECEVRLRSLSTGKADRPPGRLVRLPVLYDGEDLPAIARRLGLTESEVVALHSGNEYSVYAIGFLPGFPYAGYLPPQLRGLSRREVPRVSVPAGSVAIVGMQTGVYPNPSPGGWHLIGRTPLRIVDVDRSHFPIRAGDRIRFDAIDAREFEARRGDFP